MRRDLHFLMRPHVGLWEHRHKAALI